MRLVYSTLVEKHDKIHGGVTSLYKCLCRNGVAFVDAKVEAKDVRDLCRAESRVVGS